MISPFHLQSVEQFNIILSLASTDMISWYVAVIDNASHAVWKVTLLSTTGKRYRRKA